MTRSPTHSPTVLRRRLGMLLRQAREARGLSATEAAGRLGMTRPSLNKIENAETRRVSVSQIDAMADLYDLTPDERAEYQALAREAGNRGWWWRYRRLLGPDPLPDFESGASLIRTYETQVVPGLLQTPRYAAAVFRGGRLGGDIDSMVEARMRRGDILTRRVDPPHLWVVIDDTALRRPVGGHEVMAEQLEYLARVAQYPNVSVQVLPLTVGEHAALTGAFTLLEFPHPLDPALVYTDTAGAGHFEEEPDEVARYQHVFSDAQGAAASTVKSDRIIEEILDQHRESTT